MPRALAASAQVMPLTDREKTKRLANVRPGWQAEAWAYRRNLGELRYATAYLGNSSMRIRLFPAVYTPGDETPVPLEESHGFPPDLVAAAKDTLLRLASGGPLALSMMQKKLTENFEVAGESFLVGETDPYTGIESWSLKSTSELIVTKSGDAKVLEYPGATNQDARSLDPDTTFISRMWWPDPEWGMLADSPVRSILDLCEELLLLGKDVRATARSRLALNGILGIPDSLSIVGANPETPDDPNQDPFWQTLIETVTSALSNEGSAAAVVPLLLRGPAEALNAIKHITIQRDVHDKNIEQRQELITRIATGLDLPSEVLTGKVDLNHWTAWQVDDDSFRHHIEPVQVVQNDAWTAGFLWPMLDSYGMWDPGLIRQILVWHDPTELLTHPDRSQDAFQAWDRFAISDEALRKYLGFPDTDQPHADELLVRIVTRARSVAPAIVETILKKLDPTLPTPDLAPPGAAPAIPAGPTAAPPAPAPEGPPPTGGQAAAMQYVVDAMAVGIARYFEERSQPIVVQRPVALEYNPDQPRDADGKWGSGGGGGGGRDVGQPGTRPSPIGDWPVYRYSDGTTLDADWADGKSQLANAGPIDKVTASVRVGANGFNAEQRAAVSAYATGTGTPSGDALSYDINASLRGSQGIEQPEAAADAIDKIDAGFANARPMSGPVGKSSVLLYRGFDGQGMQFVNGLEPGTIVTDPAYLSTSIDPKFASDFAYDSGTVAKIVVPGGTTPGIYVPKAVGDAAADQGEREILLPRGLPMVYGGTDSTGSPVFTVLPAGERK